MAANYGSSAEKVQEEVQVVHVEQPVKPAGSEDNNVKQAAKIRRIAPGVVSGLVTTLVSRVGKDESQVRKEEKVAKDMKLKQIEEEKAREFQARRRMQDEEDDLKLKQMEAEERGRALEIQQHYQASKNLQLLQERMEKSWWHKAKMRKIKRKQVRAANELEFQSVSN